MEPVQFNFTLNLHDLDAPKTTYKIPLFHPTVLPACTTTSSCINQNAKISSELETLPGQGDGAVDHGLRRDRAVRRSGRRGLCSWPGASYDASPRRRRTAIRPR